jgi:hypothetical protein
MPERRAAIMREFKVQIRETLVMNVTLEAKNLL